MGFLICLLSFLNVFFIFFLIVDLLYIRAFVKSKDDNTFIIGKYAIVYDVEKGESYIIINDKREYIVEGKLTYRDIILNLENDRVCHINRLYKKITKFI